MRIKTNLYGTRPAEILKAVFEYYEKRSEFFATVETDPNDEAVVVLPSTVFFAEGLKSASDS